MSSQLKRGWHLGLAWVGLGPSPALGACGQDAAAAFKAEHEGHALNAELTAAWTCDVVRPRESSLSPRQR